MRALSPVMRTVDSTQSVVTYKDADADNYL